MTYPKVPDGATTSRMVELALETHRRQLATADENDRKLWQSLGAGSVVIGLGLAANISGGGLTIPFLGYLALVVGSVGGLWVRGYKVLPDTAGVWNAYWFRSREELDRGTLSALMKAETANRTQLQDKIRWVRVALGALAFETATLILVSIF